MADADTSTLLKLPFLLASQAQKHITANAAFSVLDALVQLAVADRDLAAPPPSPAEGDRYIVATGPSGDWTGHAGQIAAWQDGAWSFHAPRVGWLAWVADEHALMAWDGASWIAAALGHVNPVARVGVNTTADATNKLAVKSDAVLLSHDDVTPGSGDMRAVMNKASAANTASLMFQTGWFGRAEIGTAGDDKLHVKVSGNGAAWLDALVIDPATGYVGVGTDAPEGPLHIRRMTANPIHERIEDNVAAPTFTSRKARGTPAAKMAVVSGDVVQAFWGQGHDGAAWIGCANLRWVVDGAVTAGVVPTRVELWTFTAGGAHSEKARIDNAGNMGIGTAAPTCRLDVAGPARVGQYAKAALPSASTCGAGAMVYVGDEIGGAVIAFSDGTSWRRVTDRAVVS
ncbi:MAG: DUF2793 domain-containing protein [Xanthobacteraceae bacterium]|nr:MAG: DUF2793 domain-containing protein [Xanthobacteraceae bacterium]